MLESFKQFDIWSTKRTKQDIEHFSNYNFMNMMSTRKMQKVSVSQLFQKDTSSRLYTRVGSSCVKTHSYDIINNIPDCEQLKCCFGLCLTCAKRNLTDAKYLVYIESSYTNSNSIYVGLGV